MGSARAAYRPRTPSSWKACGSEASPRRPRGAMTGDWSYLMNTWSGELAVADAPIFQVQGEWRVIGGGAREVRSRQGVCKVELSIWWKCDKEIGDAPRASLELVDVWLGSKVRSSVSGLAGGCPLKNAPRQRMAGRSCSRVVPPYHAKAQSTWVHWPALKRVLAYRRVEGPTKYYATLSATIPDPPQL